MSWVTRSALLALSSSMAACSSSSDSTARNLEGDGGAATGAAHDGGGRGGLGTGGVGGGAGSASGGSAGSGGSRNDCICDKLFDSGVSIGAAGAAGASGGGGTAGAAGASAGGTAGSGGVAGASGATGADFTCGMTKCHANQVCVQPCAGFGPPGPPHCADVPTTCGANVDCACLGDVCGSPSMCIDKYNDGRDVNCWGCP